MWTSPFFSFRSFTVALLSLLLFTSCGGGKGTKEHTFIFKYNQASGISSLDPAFAKNLANIWAVNLMFNGLLQMNSELEIQPCIAKSWQVSDDGLDYTFHLRTDVYFHDHAAFPDGKGRKVTAQDFVYTFQRLIDPLVAADGAWVFREKVREDLPFEAVNDSLLIIHLKQPNRPLLSILTMPYCYVVPQEVVEQMGEKFGSAPVGTGPFQFKSWIKGESLVALKNPKYFETEAGEKLPYLDGVKVSFLGDKKSEFMSFKKGDLHFVSSIDPSYHKEVFTVDGALQPEYAEMIEVDRMPYLNTEYLGIQLDPTNLESGSNPLMDKNFRIALNFGFDRESIVQFLRNSLGKPANSGITPAGLPSFDPVAVPGYHYDPELAKEYLNNSSYKGEEVKLYTSKEYEGMTLSMVKQWQDLGINVIQEVVDASYLRDLKSRKEAAFFRASWIADYPDAESYFSMFYSGYGAPPNYCSYANTAFDSLYQNALIVSDPEQLIGMYQEMDRLIVADAPVIPIYYDEVFRLRLKGVTGLEANAMNFLDLKRVKLPAQ
jgi:peptide/nickel transport system substrate-binding protein